MIRNAIQRFMYGRYGNDQLNVGLMVLYLVLYLLYWLTSADLLYWVSMVVLFTALFRLLSRSHAKRRAENAKFLQAVGPLLKWYRPPPGGERPVSGSGRTRHTLAADAPYHPPGQGAPLLQVPQLRPAAPGPPGQGQDHRHLPGLRRLL